MKTLHFFFILALALLLGSCSPVGAVEEISQDHVKNFNLEAPEGLSLSGVYLYDLEPNSNTTIYLNNYGKTYILQVNATKTYSFWWNFDISLTSPNGTVTNTSLSSGDPFAFDYDLAVQYYWYQFTPGNTSSYDNVFDIDVYTGILPLSATLQSPNPTQYASLQFSEIGATSTSYFDIICFAVTNEEFQKQVNNNPLAPITEGLKDLFVWSWDMVVSFVEKIPFIGVHLSALMILAALTLDSIVFYTKLFFIDYAETTFLTLEFFILSYAFTKRGNIWTKFKRVVDCHIQIVEIVLNVSKSAISLFSELISAIANIIRAIRPI